MKHLDLSIINAKTIPGTESIAFQDGSYARETTELVKQLRGGYLNYAGFANAFAKVTEKHTCIWISLTFEEDYHNAHILASWLCSANALARPEYRMYEQFASLGFNAKDKPLTAYINDKTSKVGGFLKDIKNDMVICKSFFEDKNFSDEFITSILLHEIGHAYTFFQYSIRAVVYNAALSQASQNLTKAKTYEEVKIIFNETCDILDISEREFIKEVKNNENRVTQFIYLASNMTKMFNMMPSLDVSKGFSQDACEELADIFAARHGCERGIMEVRNHFELRSSGKSIMKVTMMYFFGIVTAISGSALFVAGSPLLGPMMIILGIGYTSIMNLIFTGTGHTTGYQQVKKMQNQLIERLKASKIKDAKLINMIDEAMVYGDQLLARLSNNDGAVYAALSFFKLDIRDARGMRFYQDQLEGLVANRLFLSAGKFGI